MRSPAIKLLPKYRSCNLALLSALTWLALLPATEATAEKYILGKLIVESVYTYATPPGALSAGGYLTITNTGSEDETLIGGTASFAEATQIHEMKMVDDVMKMRHLEPGLTIRAGETMELAPGGFHIMFTQLTQSLKDGQSLSASLTFGNAGELPVTFEVIDRRKTDSDSHSNTDREDSHKHHKTMNHGSTEHDSSTAKE